MNDGWHVTAQDIVHWADTNQRRAQELLPLLIQKLILASTKCSSLYFPSGDSIAKRGLDGIVINDSDNVFVPVGKSVWEVSSESQIAQKADKDYEKRSNDPKFEGKSDISFLFVTLRSWSAKTQWEDAKKALKQ